MKDQHPQLERKRDCKIY